MSLATQMRRAAAGVSSGFDPLAIAWTSAYWAEDPGWTPPADGADIADWRDAGTAGLDTDTTTTSYPDYAASGLGGKPCAIKPTSSAYLDADPFASPLSQPNTIVIVGQPHATDDDFFDSTPSRHLVDLTSGNLRLYAGATFNSGLAVSSSAPHVMIAVFNGASSIAYVDNVASAAGNAGSNSLDRSRLFYAAAGGRALTKMAFVGVYDGVLSEADRNDMEAWAADHYGVTLA
jgi:hypothetical protein